MKRVKPFILSICLTRSHVKEFKEKGLSGFEVSAKNRDETKDLKEAALRKELLIFF